MFIRAVQHNAELDAFRAEVREFCKSEMPAEVRRKQARGQHLERHEYDAWLKRLGSRGWLTGKWPKEHGGLGWQPEQFLAFQEELGRAGAPPLISFGPTMAGPVIYTFGTPEQKKKYLRGIIKNETWWCQGYSEPGAGSDLAGLKTRAVRDGNHYVVNGQKIWTSMAHWADMIFALVRTNPDAKKQEGISFLLIDMKSPGITVQTDHRHHARPPSQRGVLRERAGAGREPDRRGEQGLDLRQVPARQRARRQRRHRQARVLSRPDPAAPRRDEGGREGARRGSAVSAAAGGARGGLRDREGADGRPTRRRQDQRRAVADGRRRAEAARHRAGASHPADRVSRRSAGMAWSFKATLCMPGGTAS